MNNCIIPASPNLPAIMEVPRDHGKASALSKIRGGIIGALHRVMTQELRPPVVGWYLAGISNRQTRRAVNAVRRSAKARNAARRGAIEAVSKTAVAFSIVPTVIHGAQAAKHRAAGVYNSLKSKFAAFRRKHI